jgi:hypothetical protein
VVSVPSSVSGAEVLTASCVTVMVPVTVTGSVTACGAVILNVVLFDPAKIVRSGRSGYARGSDEAT